MKSRTKFLIQLVVSICLIILLLKIVDIPRVIGLLKGVDINFFLLLLVVITFDRLFMAYKWHLLMNGMGINASICDVVRVYYIGTFASFFLPTTVGGDLVRVYKLHSEKREGERVLSSVIIERILGFVAGSILAVSGVLFLIYLLKLNLWLFFWISLSLLIFFIAIFILSFRLHFIVGENVKKFMKRFFLFEKVKKFYEIYTEYKNKKALLCIFILLSCLEQMAPIIGNYLASLTLGISIPFIYFLAMIPIVQLFNKIPISFNGIGVNEGLLVYFFTFLGLQKSDAFAIGIVGQIAILTSVLPAIFYLGGRSFWRRMLRNE